VPSDLEVEPEATAALGEELPGTRDRRDRVRRLERHDRVVDLVLREGMEQEREAVDLDDVAGARESPLPRHLRDRAPERLVVHGGRG
jgi:hypothetical protein